MNANEDSGRKFELLKALIENTTDAIFVKDRDGRYTMINRAAATLINKTKQEVIGRTADELFAKSKAEYIIERDREVMMRKTTCQAEDVEVVDEKNRTYQSVRAPILDELGEVEGTFCISRDITDEVEAKKSLEDLSAELEARIQERTVELESEKDKFRAIAEGVDDLIALLDVDGRFLYVNHTYNQAMFGEEHTLIGISCFRDIHPDDVDLAKKTFDEIVATGISQRVEYRFVPVRGGESYIESIASALRNASGNVSKLVVVSRDITKRKRDEQERANEHHRLELLVSELKQRNRESDALAKMADELQICDTMDKAYRVVKKYADRLFPVAFGSMNILGDADNRIEEVLFWGKSKHREALFTKDQCLAMVRGGSHLVENPHNDLLCHHVANCDRPYLCLPMIAQGEAIGVLHLQFSPSNDSRALGGQGISVWLQSQQRRALSVAEHLALAIANLKLRNTLRTEAIRDPLTGLFNKRYMQENLDLEIKRCDRNSRMLGLLLLDIDHFKRFNDEFGHEAGDIVLGEVGSFLREKVRSSDMACRYGGEEFLILVTDTTRDGVVLLADKLREGVKQLKLMHNGTKLPDINFSLGIAFLPEHGKDVKQLLDAADKALYRAKDSGRDRAEIAHLQ